MTFLVVGTVCLLPLVGWPKLEFRPSLGLCSAPPYDSNPKFLVGYIFYIFFQIPINFDEKKMHLVPVNDLLSGWDCLSVAPSGVAQIRVQTVPWAVFSAPLRLQPNISGWLYEPFTYCSTVYCNRGQHENHKHS